MCGGLVKGIDIVSKLVEGDHSVASVLLFTDGEANQGHTCKLHYALNLILR